MSESTWNDLGTLATAVGNAMYARDQASQSLGIELLETRPGYARLAMRVRPTMLNGHHTCHGGFIFALADSAFAFACNSHNRVTVAASAAIDFMAPSRLDDILTATAEERTRLKRTGLYDVSVHNQRGDCIAMFRGRSHQLDGYVIDPPGA